MLLLVASSIVAVLVVEAVVWVAGFGSDQLLRDDPVLGVRFIESKGGRIDGDDKSVCSNFVICRLVSRMGDQ